MMGYNEIVAAIFPNAEFACGETYESLVWIGPGKKPTKSFLDGKRSEAERIRNNELQRAKRARAFGYEADPLFFAWQRGEESKAVWESKCAEIRNRFPYA